MLNVGNLTPVSGQGFQMVKEGGNFHGRLKIYNLNFIVEHLDIKVAVNHRIHHLGQDLIGMPPIITDVADPYRGQLPQLVVIDFGYRNIELIPEARSD